MGLDQGARIRAKWSLFIPSISDGKWETGKHDDTRGLLSSPKRIDLSSQKSILRERAFRCLSALLPVNEFGRVFLLDPQNGDFRVLLVSLEHQPKTGRPSKKNSRNQHLPPFSARVWRWPDPPRAKKTGRPLNGPSGQEITTFALDLGGMNSDIVVDVRLKGVEALPQDADWGERGERGEMGGLLQNALVYFMVDFMCSNVGVSQSGEPLLDGFRSPPYLILFCAPNLGQ